MRDGLKIKDLEFVGGASDGRSLQGGIPRVGKKLEGILLVILLAHEQERRMRRKQQQCGGEHSCAAWDQGSQPFALRTIAYLIVVLRTDYMRRSGNRAGAGTAWASAPELEWL